MSLGGWLGCHIFFVRAHNCLISDLFSGKRNRAAVMPNQSIPLCPRVGLRHSLQPWTTSWGFEETWPRWKFLLVIPAIPAAYGHMLTLHLSHHPSFQPSSIKPRTPPTSTLWLLRRAPKHDCNYNQTHTLCSVARRPSLSSKVPAHRHLHSFSGCPRLISSCSILKNSMTCSYPPAPDSASI